MRNVNSNIADYLLVKRDKVLFLELKSVKEKRLPLGNIRINQLNGLAEIKHKNIKSYFLINFRKEEKTYAVTPLNSITKELIDAGKEYYTFENLPINIGEYKSITLASLIEKDYIAEKSFKANNCSYDESYVKTTKVNAKEFSIYAKVICDKDEEVIVDTIKTKKDTKSSLNNDESFSIEVID